MSQNNKLGRVDSIFPHVKPDWWKYDDSELYLRTNADMVGNSAIDAEECLAILNVPGVSSIMNEARIVNGIRGETRALDLCCGQGRHTIKLAKDYPAIQFYGHDQSGFLIDIAEIQAIIEGCEKNTFFTIGDALSIPTPDAFFDLIIVMGNSFGFYTSDSGNAAFLEEASRVLKPGGIMLIDLVNADWSRKNFSSGGWTWAKSGSIDASGVQSEKRLVACRERELSGDGKSMASRELVIDLDRGVCQDLFYQVRLYDVHEMEKLLESSQMKLQNQDMKELEIPTTGHVEDLGMMKHRHLFVAKKCTPGNSITI